MTMRILHIIGSLRLGGAQIALRQMIEHSDSTRFEHFIYPLRAKPIEIPLSKNIIANPYRNYDPRKFFDILRVCRQYRIDLVHTHLHKDALGGLLGSFFFKLPVVVHEHGVIFLPGPQYDLFRLSLRLLQRRAARFVAVSGAAAEELTRAAGIRKERISVIYNGIDLQRFAPHPALRNQVRQTLSLSDQHFVIGFLGRLSRDKGVDILLEAAGTFLSGHPDRRLLLVGNGPLEESLRRRAEHLKIAKQVIFAGFQAHPEQWIAAFDIGCVPSRSESFGLAAVEMMAMNIPLICAEVGGLKELTSAGRNAVVPKQNTPGQIAAAVNELAENSPLRNELARQAAQFTTQLSVDTFVEKIEALYTSLLKPQY